MTKFIDKSGKVKEVKKTVFTECLLRDFALNRDSLAQPEEWDNVEYLGTDSKYGDVFKAWDDDPNDFTLYFGTKGDEDYINE